MKTGDSFVQNTQASVNVDLGRAGLTDGGLFHFTLQSRYGAPPDETLSAGASAPQYVGYVQPGPYLYRNTLASEYFLVQPLTPKFSAVLGKISDVFIPDQTLFGNSYKYYFANFNLNKNPITTGFYNPTAWAALAVARPTEWWTIGGGVLDTESKSSNLATDAFKWVNLYLTSVFSYSLGDLPGQFTPSLNWSNKPKVDLSRPLAPVVLATDEVLSTLSGSPAFVGLSSSYKHDSWFAIANASQFLYVKDEPEEIKQKLKSGEPINGFGVFARGGVAPQSSNTITADASVSLFAHGLIEGRGYDSFGAGFYYNRISDHIKDRVAALTANRRILQDETGVEAFYDFALTPAIRLIPSYQHIWNPLLAATLKGRYHADIFLARVTVAW
jgi:porin